MGLGVVFFFHSPSGGLMFLYFSFPFFLFSLFPFFLISFFLFFLFSFFPFFPFFLFSLFPFFPFSLFPFSLFPFSPLSPFPFFLFPFLPLFLFPFFPFSLFSFFPFFPPALLFFSFNLAFLRVFVTMSGSVNFCQCRRSSRCFVCFLFLYMDGFCLWLCMGWMCEHHVYGVFRPKSANSQFPLMYSPSPPLYVFSPYPSPFPVSRGGCFLFAYWDHPI